MLTTVVKVIELAREIIEKKRKNAALSVRKMGIKTEIAETCAVSSATGEQLTSAECQVTPLKTQLDDSQLAFEKVTSELFRTEVDLQAQEADVKEWFNADRARVKRLERDISAKTEKRTQLLTKHRQTNETVSRQLVESRSCIKS